MALILYKPLFWIAALTFAWLLFSLARRTRLRWWPAFILRLLLFFAILVPVFMPKVERKEKISFPQREVLLLDESASIPQPVVERNRQQAQLWKAAALNRIIITFGAQPEIVLSTVQEWPPIDRRESDLSAALSVAQNLLRNNPGKIILVSDGAARSTLAVDSQVQTLAEDGNRLEVIPLPKKAASDDPAVWSLWTPDYLWSNTTFAAGVQLHLPEEAEVTLQLELNGKQILERKEQFVAGDQNTTFPVQAPGPGVITLSASIEAPDDPNPENNIAYTTARIFAPPDVMFITEQPEAAAGIVQSMKDSGLVVELLAPEKLPMDVPTLEKYQVIFLDNLLVQTLNQEQVAVLKMYVSDLGKGLIFLGGRWTYTLGGFKNSPLEPLLPVHMDPPDRQQRDPVTFVLLIDGSFSMAYTVNGSRPIDLAKEAAMRVIETLQPEDNLAIVTYSDSAIWDLPLGKVGEGLNLRLAIDATSRIKATGGTQMYRAMQEVLKTLGDPSSDEKRNILLLSDGKSADGSLVEFRRLAQQAARKEITISTIALGETADAETMTQIAASSNGRYYKVTNFKDLPKVMIHETRAAQSENVVEGDTSLVTDSDIHPVLAGFNPADFPVISGYNALKSRSDEGAEDILLSSSFGDPILSAWHFGLGRVVAWMSDDGEEWAAQWPAWPGSGQFWSQVVRYALPDPNSQPEQVQIAAGDTHVTAGVLLRDTAGMPENMLLVKLVYVDADNKAHSYLLPQVSPGFYSFSFPRPPVGAYRGVIQFERDGIFQEIPANFSVNLPGEDRPANLDMAQENLVVWAEKTGGSALTWGEIQIDQEAILPEEVDKQPDGENESGWLMLLLIASWPLEILIRRRWLPWK